MNQITVRTPETTADEWIGYIEAGELVSADTLLTSLEDFGDDDFVDAFDAAIKAKRPEWHPNGEYNIEIATKGAVKSREKLAAAQYSVLAASDNPMALYTFLLVNGHLNFTKLMRAVSDQNPEWVFVIPADGLNSRTCLPREIAEREVERLNANGDSLILRTRTERYPELAIAH